ncbi:uncharacterized protein BJ212DRAFT_1332715 [Suillus subaureus]|uniref:Uncharacterized protein n=1 Tax=Suillus subaureus TaxID=48587 RepID=A0A9P7JGU9_9AGAM|nr:uncharacterized protein BJ212DRAFT_1332715 [Suillus subaureus]KAG1821649.1 hypothetical protein BJ212DRAFT_1332715 [Suillus subaureus]
MSARPLGSYNVTVTRVRRKRQKCNVANGVVVRILTVVMVCVIIALPLSKVKFGSESTVQLNCMVTAGPGVSTWLLVFEILHINVNRGEADIMMVNDSRSLVSIEVRL